MNKIEDIDIINYIINKNATAKETAEYFNVSLSTIKKRLSDIKLQLDDDSPIKEEILKIIACNQRNGRVKGGMSINSGSKINISIEEIAQQAIKVLANNMTIEEASANFNTPTSTLYEHFKLLQTNGYNDIYCDLKVLFEYHRVSKNSINDIRLFKLRQKYIKCVIEENNKEL